MAKKRKGTADKSQHYTHLEVQEADVVIENNRLIKNRPGTKAPIPDGCYVRLMPGSLVPGHMSRNGGVSTSLFEAPVMPEHEALEARKKMRLAKTRAELWRTAMSTISACAALATLIVVLHHA